MWSLWLLSKKEPVAYLVQGLDGLLEPKQEVQEVPEEAQPAQVQGRAQTHCWALPDRPWAWARRRSPCWELPAQLAHAVARQRWGLWRAPGQRCCRARAQGPARGQCWG